MANTYTLISSTVLGSSTASVTFSSIPQTYTDLVLKISARTNIASNSGNIFINFNGTSTNYSSTYLYGVNNNPGSSRDTLYGSFHVDATAANLTTNTFGSAELYFPNYTVAQNKPSSAVSVRENNSSSIWAIGSDANLWSNTAAITSIAITTDATYNFITDSSFYLYGIKNS